MATEHYTIHRSPSVRTTGGHTYWWSRQTGAISWSSMTSERACLKSALANAQAHEVTPVIVRAYRNS